jgi:signal transduction histidine kinase
VNAVTSFQLVDAGVHCALALVWAFVAQSAWRFLRTRRPHSRFFRMLPVVGGAVAVSYGVFTAIILLRPVLRQSGLPGLMQLYVLNDCCVFLTVVLARHMALFFPTPERPPPSARWLVSNYGAGLLMCAFGAVALGLVDAPVVSAYTQVYPVLRVAYQVIMLASVVWQLLPVARPGVWGPGGAAWVARHADVAVLAGGIVSLGAFFVASATDFGPRRQPWEEVPTVRNLGLDALTGIGFAVPLAVRMLGSVLRGLLTTTVMLAAVAAVYFGMDRLSITVPVPGLRALSPIATILVLALILAPGQAWLRPAIDHVVFRRTRRRRADLQAFLHTLSPELTAADCCQRAAAEVTRVMQLRGAAMLLRDGQALVHGTITFEPLAALCKDGAALQHFPTHALVGFGLRELSAPLNDALTRTDVVGVIPINSPRRPWGLLLISAGLLAATFSEEDENVLQGFADQLALVLDGAELLARALAVERSLAHSEKLAAIGELAARVAHEIRNPVTAARSLAQQMARDPVSPLNAEHAELILTELERVERQVAALLRFARREEFHLEPMDLAELTRGTLQALRGRLEAAGIAVAVDARERIVVRGDREKLRQALINLIDNAVDAVRDAGTMKQLSIAVDCANGTGRLRVHDSGPGVPPEVVPRLFEPFFSLKPHGTGLGLAIAKRTIEAHGGHIEATTPAGGGLTLSIDLPLASAG